MEQKKTLLSISDLVVKFRVRGRILTAIRGISLDIYENESIAIVGESGSGKSVFTKTFAGMLDDNGFIDQGDIIFHDADLEDTNVRFSSFDRYLFAYVKKQLDKNAPLEFGAESYRALEELESGRKRRMSLTDEKKDALTDEIGDLVYEKTEAMNLLQTLDGKKEKDRIRALDAQIKTLDKEIKDLRRKEKRAIADHKRKTLADKAYQNEYSAAKATLIARRAEEIKKPIDDAIRERNSILAKEIYLSVGRYSIFKRIEYTRKLIKALRLAMMIGADLNNEDQKNKIFDTVAFRVKYLDETRDSENGNLIRLHGVCTLNVAKIHYAADWTQIRGTKIATVFQDPMTSLNPIITIGKQITSVILKHQNCSEAEARERAVILMKKVGIPNAEDRFDDYPFQYSGGMRQRIVIAIALSCQPKILICDEPTTALDVTIQAQILRLIKDLQKEFHYTTVFITHDLGVVANIADRVAVLYAGQIVELGTVEDVFYDPRHPYTWALLSSLPQLAEKNTKLYSITGTPPSLYNKIIGDPFAPRNPYCLKIDTVKDAPMFKVSETHYAKTWLLDPRAPKMEKPEIIRDIHGKLVKGFNIQEV